MKRTDIIKEVQNAMVAGNQFTAAENKFFRAVYETAEDFNNLDEDTVMSSDHIDDAKTFVAMMHKYGIKKLISTESWSGAIARGMELQNAGLKVVGFEYIEKISDFFGREKVEQVAGLVFTV